MECVPVWALRLTCQRSWFVQQGNQIKSTHQKPGISDQSSTAGIPTRCLCWDLQGPHSWRGGFLLIPTFSYGAIYCSLSRILIFSKLLWAEHSYPLMAFLWLYPGKQWSTDLFRSWRQGHYGNLLTRRACISSCEQKGMVPEAICLMVHFRINDLLSQFLTLHSS